MRVPSRSLRGVLAIRSIVSCVGGGNIRTWTVGAEIARLLKVRCPVVRNNVT